MHLQLRNAGGPAYYVLHPQKGITICILLNLPGLQKPGIISRKILA